MFDISWGEMLVVGVVALIVIGPKELPSTIRAVGRGVAKLRTMAGEFRAQFDDAMRDAELDQVKKDVTDLRESARNIVADTLAPVRDDLSKAFDEVKDNAAEVSGVKAANETLGAIESDAKALGSEIAAEEAKALAAAPGVPEAANSSSRPGNAA